MGVKCIDDRRSRTNKKSKENNIPIDYSKEKDLKDENKEENKKEKIENKNDEKKNNISTDEEVPNEDINNNIIKSFQKKKNKFENIRWKKTLEIHNKFRKKHGIENLKLNEDLCKIAQSSAEKYSETNIENMYMITPKLYKDNIVGENIAIIDNNDNIKFEDIVNKWYEEKKNYKFNSNKYVENTGHFTQLIWKETKEVGFGYKKIYGKMYFIAIYYPAGNILNQFKYNVLEEQY